jgi:hypothetical protein
MIVETDIDLSELGIKPKPAPAPKEVTDDTLAPISADGKWQCLDGFKNPAEFLAFFDPNINSGKIVLHKWQAEVGEMFGAVKPTGKHPFKFCLCAANGSGKDAFVIAPFALWFICCKKRATVIITSSSGIQLTNQTENYIRGMAEKVNSWAQENFGCNIIKVRKRRISCLLSGSEIMLFATDEAGKAEGYHPVEPDSEMAIIVNEAKNVMPEIFGALRRCTGYNYWLNVSTPGEPIGEFYKSWEHWPNKRRVTYYDCPHQADTEFEYDKKTLGEHDPLFRSKWLALFTFVGGKTVVNQIALERLRRKNLLGEVKHIRHQVKGLRIGMDIALSTHGDESVISAWDGNKQIKQFIYRIKDATVLADNMDRDLLSLKISRNHPFIFGDDGNVGRAVIDILRKKGWTGINRVLNQSSPKNKKQFRNRGAELWYKFAKLVEGEALIFLNDEKLMSQIASRKYKETDTGLDKLLLESKATMTSAGFNSPDRADAAVLAFTDTNPTDFVDRVALVDEGKVQISKEEQLRQLMRDLNFPKRGAGHKAAASAQYSLARINKHHKMAGGGMNKRLLKWS